MPLRDARKIGTTSRGDSYTEYSAAKVSNCPGTLHAVSMPRHAAVQLIQYLTY